MKEDCRRIFSKLSLNVPYQGVCTKVDPAQVDIMYSSLYFGLSEVCIKRAPV